MLNAYPATKTPLQNAHSRRWQSPRDDDDLEDDVDNYFDARLYYHACISHKTYPAARIYLHEREYEEDNLILRRYLEHCGGRIIQGINNTKEVSEFLGTGRVFI